MIHKYSFYPYCFIISDEDYPNIWFFKYRKVKIQKLFYVHRKSEGRRKTYPQHIHTLLERAPPSLESTSFSFLSISLKFGDEGCGKQKTVRMLYFSNHFNHQGIMRVNVASLSLKSLTPNLKLRVCVCVSIYLCFFLTWKRENKSNLGSGFSLMPSFNSHYIFLTVIL